MRETAERLKIGETEAYRLAARGEIPSVKIGRRRRVPEQALDEWIQNRIQGGIWSKDFNANAYRLQVMNRFPQDWRDRQEVEFKASLAKIDFSRLPTDLLDRIANGEHPLAVLAEAVDGAPAGLLGPGEGAG